MPESMPSEPPKAWSSVFLKVWFPVCALSMAVNTFNLPRPFLLDPVDVVCLMRMAAQVMYNIFYTLDPLKVNGDQ